MRANTLHNLARVLAIGSVLWCVGVGWWLWLTPIRYSMGSSGVTQIVYRSFAEISRYGSAPLIVPLFIATLGASAAWRHHVVLTILLAVALFGYAILAVFSIGEAYLPGAGLLLVAGIVNLEGRP